MTLSNKIIYCRKKAGMSQEELGEVIGVSRQAISKWETGEATPEVGKLLLLSKNFGVTTDWLLSDDEPVEEEKKADETSAQCENPYYHKTAGERAYPDWMDNLPKSFSRVLMRFGWLAGVYIALVGAAFTLIGGIIKLAVGYMVEGFSSTTDAMMSEMNGLVGGFGYVPGFDGGMFNEYQGAVDSMVGEFTKFNPVSIISTIMLVIGIIMIIGGIVLAIVLKKYGNKK